MITFLVLLDFDRQFRSVRMAYRIGECFPNGGIQKLQCLAAFWLFTREYDLTANQLCHLKKLGLQGQNQELSTR